MATERHRPGYVKFKSAPERREIDSSRETADPSSGVDVDEFLESSARGLQQIPSQTTAFPVHSVIGREPVDQWNAVYVAFVLSGIGYMLPFTCFIAAVDYYQGRFPDTTIIFDMTATTIVIGSLGVIFNNLVVESLSLLYRVMLGYVISLSVLSALTLCDVTWSMFPGRHGYWITLVAVAIIAVGCAIQQSSFYGYANMLPRRYTQAVMIGESFAGVSVSVNRILTKALLDNERKNTIFFFSVSIAVIVLCCVAFLLARRTPLVKQSLMKCAQDRLCHEVRQKKINSENSSKQTGHFGSFELRVSDEETSPNRSLGTSDTFDQSDRATSRNPVDDVAFRGDHVTSDTAGLTHGSTGHVDCGRVARIKERLRSRWEVIHEIWPYMLSFGMTFFVTVCLYPGVVSEVISCSLKSWMPVLLMACFNGADALGKMLTSVKGYKSKLQLLLCSLCRVILIPLAVLCCRPRFQPVLSGEAWPISVTLILGVSNGYFGSLPLILAPSNVAPRLRELCGNTMMFAFNIAIVCGAFSAYGLDMIIGPHPDLDKLCDPGSRNTSAVNNLTAPFGHKLELTLTGP